MFFFFFESFTSLHFTKLQLNKFNYERKEVVLGMYGF